MYKGFDKARRMPCHDSIMTRNAVKILACVFPAVFVICCLYAEMSWAGDLCPDNKRRLLTGNPEISDATNPTPDKYDFVLPMPCGGSMAFRQICVPSHGYFDDYEIQLGCNDCGRNQERFMEGRHVEAVSGSFLSDDMPETWKNLIVELEASGNGRCSEANGNKTAFYYFMGKYEITRFQWNAIMGSACEKGAQTAVLTPDDPRPMTGVTWYDAVSFTEKYTSWLLKNAKDSLPGFSGGRTGFIRLPTETEWEYAARGGQMASENELIQLEFFPMDGKTPKDYAVFTDMLAGKPPESLYWIGTKCANPLGLFDTAGNAGEMVLDTFHFTIGNRMHGAAGGFVAKGGSYRKLRAEIAPGRREELPFFLAEGPYWNNDLGFRVVISGIITPRERIENLKAEWDDMWAKTGGKPFRLCSDIETLLISKGLENEMVVGEETVRDDGTPETPADVTFEKTDEEKALTSELASVKANEGKAETASVSKFDFSTNPAPALIIDALMKDSKDDVMKATLSYLRNTLETAGAELKRQKAEAVKGTVRSALYSAEAMVTYARQKESQVKELNMLERVKKKITTESAKQTMNERIANAVSTITLLDDAIAELMDSFIDRFKELLLLPDDELNAYMDVIYKELNENGDFDRDLTKKLDFIKEEIKQYRTTPGPIDPDAMIKALTGGGTADSETPAESTE